MGECADFLAIIYLYLDSELTTVETSELIRHLKICRQCTEAMGEAEAFSQRVRAARPSMNAPDSLRNAVSDKMRASSRRATDKSTFRKIWISGWPMRIAATMILVGFGILAYVREKSAGMQTIEAAALAAHEQFQQHNLPLDVTSSSPEEVEAWFTQRVKFPFRMAKSGIAAYSQARYRLLGGRLIMIDNEPAALMAFALPDQVFTLLVAPQRLGEASGGTLVRSDDITFHGRQAGKLHLVSWNNRRLTYVLTSIVPIGNSHDCSTCHNKSGARAELNNLSSNHDLLFQSFTFHPTASVR